VDARKVKQGRAEALALLKRVNRVIAAKGKQVVDVDLTAADRPGDEALLTLVMGPTGNLRAPTLRVGKTLLVGFNEATYRQVLGLPPQVGR
jgi:hypothetical protein